MKETTELLVRDIMVLNPVAVLPETTVAEVAHMMNVRNIGAVVVVRDGRVEGVFSERDLLRRAAESRDAWSCTPVERFMTRNPVCVAPDQPWAEAMSIMDQRRIRHLPVAEDGKLVGMLSVRDLLHHRAEYLESLVQERTAELAARNAALTERDQQLTRNLKVAAKIQQRLLPDNLPDFEPFRFAIACHGHDQVTGDYHDFIQVSPDRLGILIADASGHGVPAAFVSVMAKMVCTAYCHDLQSPAAMLRAMNEHLGDLIEAEHFITMFAAMADRRTRELTYARAGHPLPLVYRAAGGEVNSLDAAGVMIGVMPSPGYVDQRIQLLRGDKVLFYTDGASECRNSREELLGVTSLQAFLRNEGHRPCAELLNRLEETLHQFQAGRPFDDDVTIIVLEVT